MSFGDAEIFRNPRNISLGFGDAHVPARNLAPGKRRPAMLGNFSSRKAARGWLRASSPLMLDGLIHPETNPRWLRLADAPMRVRGWYRGASGAFKSFEHVADVGVIDKSGCVVFIDFIPLAIQKERSDFDARCEGLRELYVEEHGVSYVVLDERDVYAEPRFTNLKLLRWHAGAGENEAFVSAVRIVLADAALPTTIGAVEVACLALLRDEPGPADERADAVFSAIMRLALLGTIDLDLSHPLSAATTISAAPAM